jgi:hypothetical protein
VSFQTICYTMCIPIPIPVPQISQVQADVGLTQVLYNYVLISYHPAHPTSRSSRQWVGVLCEAGVVIYPPSCLISPRLPLHPASRCLQRWWWWCSLSPVLPCRLPSPSSFHPPTTPRAVAREAGGRWCVVVVSSPSTNPQPPYEQILVGVGVSRCSSSRLPSLPSSSPLPPVVVSPPSCRRLPSLPSSSPLPPVVISPPSCRRTPSHPPCKQGLAAVAVVASPPSPSVVVIVGPPAIHLTSSCS